MPFTFTGEPSPWQTSKSSSGFGFATSTSTSVSFAVAKPSPWDLKAVSTTASQDFMFSTTPHAIKDPSEPSQSAISISESGKPSQIGAQTGVMGLLGSFGGDLKSSEELKRGKGVEEEGAEEEEEQSEYEEGSLDYGAGNVASVESAADTPLIPFRFLDLPAELRVWVYRELLAPVGQVSFSEIHLRDHAHQTSNTVSLSPAILRTSRQIHHEAKDIPYDENTIFICADLFYESSWLLAKCQMSPAALQRFTSTVLLVQDWQRDSGRPLIQDYSKVDWRPLQTMTGLKCFSIVCFNNMKKPVNLEERTALMRQIIERLPAKCTVEFGAQNDAGKRWVSSVLEQTNSSSAAKYYDVDCYEVDSKILQECASEALAVQGCKSGMERDFRFPEKRGLFLTPLMGAEEQGDVSVLGS
ncbi:hypothetical protein LTR56_002192 [Elasticomyces elasticus]|nr:hypothetical protein LTR56_002192 [Elasticomyces elasticus]KAK3666071.1 hypothetical protein LTR22_003074 [Elasticomyces elasticus]KAK4929558.1 hypothetical protein LTR49_003853 [Elasticomyces elasticus]KAK5767484.1 hypothetical protein LTS12_002325 [Elasticomyces elasticus]